MDEIELVLNFWKQLLDKFDPTPKKIAKEHPNICRHYCETGERRPQKLMQMHSFINKLGGSRCL